MAFDYSRSVATALRLITRYGQAMTLTKTTAGTYSTATGGSADSPTDYTCVGALLPISEAAKFGLDRTLVDGMVGHELAQVYLAASGLTVTPAPSDKLTDASSNVWKVLSVTTLNPAGTAVFHQLVVARG